MYSTLRASLGDADDDGLLAVLPFTRRMASAKDRSEDMALDETQLLALLEYAAPTPFGPATRLAA
ncbi:MAG: hypothetical protein HKL92_06910 [Candidatus Eremiobacteraeota bacterium]|nr:hypothetical protein [Candidatus Eremiobacteraeota bacterium]NNM93058.1 hypothetical protein [Candidatus Eremiobacteraeota bacterium]